MQAVNNLVELFPLRYLVRNCAGTSLMRLVQLLAVQIPASY